MSAVAALYVIKHCKHLPVSPGRSRAVPVLIAENVSKRWKQGLFLTLVSNAHMNKLFMFIFYSVCIKLFFLCQFNWSFWPADAQAFAFTWLTDQMIAWMSRHTRILSWLTLEFLCSWASALSFSTYQRVILTNKILKMIHFFRFTTLTALEGNCSSKSSSADSCSVKLTAPTATGWLTGVS